MRPILGLFLLIVLYQYLQVEFYHFPAAQPFSGEQLYNPYLPANNKWYKANFHAHAKAWMGLTHGHQSGDEVQKRYLEYGYDIPCISDYYRINQEQDKQLAGYIPVYEHGSDLNKSHRLAIGSEKVDFYDIWFSPNASFKQYLINRLKNNSPLVCINHPFMRDGHPSEMLQQLSGFDLIELANRGRISSGHWDAVLSAGKAVWALGNDDAHDVYGDAFGCAWTMVGAPKLAKSEMLDALRKGSAYVATRNFTNPDFKPGLWANQFPDNALKFVQTDGLDMEIQLAQKANRINLIGQGGRVVRSFYHTDHLSYHFSQSDTYIRAEVHGDFNTLYLNPIIRCNGKQIPDNQFAASIDIGTTVCFRAVVLLIGLFLFFRLFPRSRRWLQVWQWPSFPSPPAKRPRPAIF